MLTLEHLTQTTITRVSTVCSMVGIVLSQSWHFKPAFRSVAYKNIRLCSPGGHIPRGPNLYSNAWLFPPLWSSDDLYEHTNEHQWKSGQALVILNKWVSRNRQVWGYMLLVPAFRRQRQAELYELEDSLFYTESCRGCGV